MAVVSLKDNIWVNDDGLPVVFGTSEADLARSGEYMTLGGRHWVEVTINLPSLATVASTNETIVAENVTIPAGAFIEQVDVLVTKETAGTNANLDLGLVDQDRTTEIDFNGFLAAADAFNGGTDLGTLTSYVVGTTEAGALIGTKITNTGLITASADTADFTAGVIVVRIYYSVPLAADL